MVDINPQQVLMIAEQLIGQGWVQGKEKDEDGVCIVGALRDAVGQVLYPQVEALCATIPEFMALTEDRRTAFVRETVARYENPLIAVFRARFAQVFPVGMPVEMWNDSTGRQKQQVLEAMRATLEIVTAECLETWDKAEGNDSMAQESVAVLATVCK